MDRDTSSHTPFDDMLGSNHGLGLVMPPSTNRRWKRFWRHLPPATTYGLTFALGSIFVLLGAAGVRQIIPEPKLNKPYPQPVKIAQIQKPAVTIKPTKAKTVTASKPTVTIVAKTVPEPVPANSSPASDTGLSGAIEYAPAPRAAVAPRQTPGPLPRLAEAPIYTRVVREPERPRRPRREPRPRRPEPAPVSEVIDTPRRLDGVTINASPLPDIVLPPSAPPARRVDETDEREAFQSPPRYPREPEMDVDEQVFPPDNDAEYSDMRADDDNWDGRPGPREFDIASGEEVFPRRAWGRAGGHPPGWKKRWERNGDWD